MFYINDQYLDLNTIKLADGSFYSGSDEVRMKISQAWQEIEKRFFRTGEPVVFKTPGIMSGNGKGTRGYSYPRGVSINTRKGKIKVVWCEDVTETNGKKVYSPVCKRITVNEKYMTLTEDKIEEILFMFLFNPNVLSAHNPIGRTYLEDKEAEAQKYEETETNAAVISYWLFREESPFYKDEDKLSTLCLAWGIHPDGKSLTYRKQLLSEAVKAAERRNEIEYNLKAFNNACEKLKDGQDTRGIEVLALIQRCISARTIRLDAEGFRWTMLGTDGKTVVKTICKVPPQQLSMAKTILRNYLISNPDEYSMLSSTVTGEPVETKHDRVILSVPIPEEVDENFIKNELTWPDRKQLWRWFGNDIRDCTDAKCVPLLIEKLVLNKVTVPHEVKRK